MTNEELFALVKKNPISVGCAVLCVALGAGIYFRSDLVPAAMEDLTKKSDEGQRLAANLQNAAQLKEQVDALAVCSKELDARLIHASQTITNYQYFYKLQADTGVKMTSISTGPISGPARGAAKALYGGVPFAVSLQGSLAQVLDYLHRLESGMRYCRIMSVTCGAPGGDRGGPMTFNLNLELLGQP